MPPLSFLRPFAPGASFPSWLMPGMGRGPGISPTPPPTRDVGPPVAPGMVPDPSKFPRLPEVPGRIPPPRPRPPSQRRPVAPGGEGTTPPGGEVPPGGEAPPSGEGGEAGGGEAVGGEFEETMQNFQNALAAYITRPWHIWGQKLSPEELLGMGRPGEMVTQLRSRLGNTGWGAPVANWMRQNRMTLEQQFLEQFMKRQLPGGQVPEYTPMDFLAQLDPRTQYMMTPPAMRGGGRVPITGTRRLRV